ncbi:hypothetical protein GCM10010531_03420 [Blastococcus jejuensis]|uniref:Peptidase M1 membrane alanine aminopeptidase domain-containing protein n=1 Tax=Blastococcus jejuensis TaxID=351224 RepID=A0ABP6NVE7_9ACTN
MTRPARAVVVLTAALLLPACTSFADSMQGTPATDGGSAPATPTGPPPDALGEDACPDERAEPDPDRPRIALDLRLEDDLVTVTGTESVAFTPDVATDELVFRLVPNAPDSASAGNRLDVDGVTGDDVAGGRYDDAGADGPGGLYVVDLDDELAAGETTEVELAFTLTLGSGTFDRVGTDDGVSWWASGAPLLAWEPGVGWARDPFVNILGETTVSPASDVSISVSAPEALTVLMTGDQAEPSAAEDGRRTWTSAEPVARDVSVAVGEFTTEERTTPGGTRVTVGVLPDPELPAGRLADWTVEAVDDLEGRFGAFPYDTLSVALLPDYGGGIEYPSMILEATPSRSVLVHEVAHQWFYGMIGNSQFRDPWLDEAFATYAEATLDPASAEFLSGALGLPGDVGGSMADFEGSTGTYFDVVYGKGGAALLAARAAAGPEAFDEALRCYVDANAWTVATPRDVAVALADLPEALVVLGEAQAVDKDDLPSRTG